MQDQIDIKNKHGARLFDKILTQKRHMARIQAIQAMYAYDINKNQTTAKLEDVSVDAYRKVLYFVKDMNISPSDTEGFTSGKYASDYEYLQNIIYITIKNISKIDELISEHLNNKWTIDKLNPVVRAILRCGIAESLFGVDIDIPIIGSEYTNIASAFLNHRCIGFINGIIDNVSKAKRKEDGNTH